VKDSYLIDEVSDFQILIWLKILLAFESSVITLLNQCNTSTYMQEDFQITSFMRIIKETMSMVACFLSADDVWPEI
jgi:hypothetical protein